MKKLIILSIGLLCLQLSAQNVELTIAPNSIKVQDDYLYFRYRIQNNSDTAFVLYDAGSNVDIATSEKQYNAGMVDVETDEKWENWDHLSLSTNANVIGLSGFIYDEKGNFRPRTYSIRNRHWWPIFVEQICGDSIIYTLIDTTPIEKKLEQEYKDSIYIIYSGKYIILNPDEFVEYERRLNIEKDEIGELEKGTYKFKLKYGSFSNINRKEYIKSKENTPSLKNTVLFEGEIWSGFYPFKYP